MTTDETIRSMILNQTSTDRVREAARQAGMRTLAEDGWRLVALGITTVEEVLSVTTAKESERATPNGPDSGPSAAEIALRRA